MPLTIPEVAPIAATPGDKLDHEPPGVVLLSEMVWPVHTPAGPEMAAGSALTVIGFVFVHPDPSE